MDKPVFIDINPEIIIAQIKDDYEQLTGKTLYPGQVEQLLINAFAYREYMLRVKIQDAAMQNLVEFSRAPFLDYLGQLVGVRRLPASKAVCPVKLTLIAGHGNIIIPKDLRIQSIDGEAVFLLDDELSVDAGTNEVIANFTCISEGEKGNGYESGKISIILDPQPYLFSVENIETTTGGSDQETDLGLRNRIMIAPQSFSNAGSRGAYEYFARSANPGIAAVGITSPVPGQVNIYPLMKNGEMPNQSILDEVYNACNSEKVRPLTDTVIVQEPGQKTYNITVNLTLITGTVESEAIQQVKAGLQNYANSRRNNLGLDVVRERIISECMRVSNVYNVTVLEPAFTVVINPDEVAKCENITVNVTGYSDE